MLFTYITSWSLSGAYLGGGFGGLGPPGSSKGRQKERKKERERKREGREEGKRGEEKKGKRKKKGKKEGARKKKERKKVKSMWREGAIQYQVQAGAPGRKTSEAPNWRRKGREGRHTVSSESRGSREENVRGAKLTEKRTRGAPCSFKCKQGLQGRKHWGCQIDGEKERGTMQFQVQAGAPRKKTSGVPNWQRKRWEGHHVVSSASRGSNEENVRGAKLTEKRTRGAPCSFKCKQGPQGRKRQGWQIDREKDERGAM